MIRAIATSTALQVLSLALGMVDRILVSALMLRMWGVGVFEDWSVLIAAASLLGFLDLGLHQTFSNAYAHALQSGKRDVFQRQVSIALSINGVIALAGLAILGAASLFAGLPGPGPGAGAQTAMVGQDRMITLALLAMVVLVQTFSPSVVAIYRAQAQYSRGVAVDVAASAVRLLVTLAALALGGGPVLFAAVQLVSIALVSLVVVPFDLRRLDRGLSFAPAVPTPREVAGIARTAPQFYAQHIANIVLLNAPVLVLAGLADTKGLIAAFVLTRTLMNIARQLISVVANSIAIELSRQYLSGTDKSEIKDRLSQADRFVTVLSGTGFGVLLTIMPTLMSVWSGERLASDAVLTVILGLGVLLAAPFSTILIFMTYVGEVKEIAFSKLIGVAAACLAGLALVSAFGVYGVALALAIEALISGSTCLGAISRWWNATARVRLAHLLTYLALGMLPVILIEYPLKIVAQAPLAQLVLLLTIALPIGLFNIVFFGMAREDRLWLRRQIETYLLLFGPAFK